MPSAKTTGIFVGSALVVGIIVGTKSAVPETKVITVPKTEVHTVEEKVYVTEPLPESCVYAIELLSKANEHSGTETNAAGEILLALTELNRVAVADDYAGVNKAIESLRLHKDRLDTAVIETNKMKLEVDSAYEQCTKDVQ